MGPGSKPVRDSARSVRFATVVLTAILVLAPLAVSGVAAQQQADAAAIDSAGAVTPQMNQQCEQAAAFGANSAIEHVARLYGPTHQYTALAQAAAASAVDGVREGAKAVPAGALTPSVCEGTAYGATMGGTLGAISYSPDPTYAGAAARGAAEGAMSAVARQPDAPLSGESPFVVPQNLSETGQVTYVPLMVCPTQGAAQGAFDNMALTVSWAPQTAYGAAYFGAQYAVSDYVGSGYNLCNHIMNQGRGAATYYNTGFFALGQPSMGAARTAR